MLIIIKTAFFSKIEIRLANLLSTKLLNIYRTQRNKIESCILCQKKNSTFFDGNKEVEFWESKNPKKALQPQYRIKAEMKWFIEKESAILENLI